MVEFVPDTNAPKPVPAIINHSKGCKSIEILPPFPKYPTNSDTKTITNPITLDIHQYK